VGSPVAACDSTTCQGSHSVSPDRGVSAGCCISGSGVNNDESTASWSYTTCFAGGYYDGQYAQRDWTETMANPVHDPTCRETTGVMGGQSCIPCGFAPFQTGSCTTKPVRSATRHHHQRTNFNNYLVWDHTWVTAATQTCACGTHGCTQ
jgi:hypothetical protein